MASTTFNRIGCVMVSVLVLSVVDRWFETRSGKTYYHMLLGMGGAYERLVKINKCRLSNEMNG
jgi:hypothetical protein